jgi:predicted exporter
VLGLAAVCMGVVLLHRDALWNDDLADFSPVSAQAKALDRELRTQSGAADLRYIVAVGGASREDALVTSERVAATLDRAVAAGWIAAYDFPARYLPSEALQRQRQQALPDERELRARIDEALRDSRLRPEAFAPFVADVAQARTMPLLDAERVRGTALGLKLDTLLVRDGTRWTALLPLSGVDAPDAVAGLLRQASISGAALLDLKAEADSLVAGYRVQAVRATLVGLGLIALVLGVGVGSIPRAIRLLVPVGCAVAITAGVLLALGQRLTIFHFVALLLVVGVGLNYALFFARSHASPQERALAALSVLVAALATLIAAVALATTGTPVLRAIGMTTGIGVVAGFLACAVMAPRNEAYGEPQ